MILKDIISPFRVWKRVFEKPYTEMKPITERPGAYNYRGFHANDIQKCVGCGTCESICQNVAIDMIEVEGISTTRTDSGLRPSIDYGRCCWCGLCVDICPTRSLRMTNEYTWISANADDFVFTPGVDKKPWDNKQEGYKCSEHYNLLELKRTELDFNITSNLNLEEMFKKYSEAQAYKEAMRCTECGLCITACPGKMPIPDYIAAIRDGAYEKAIQIMTDTNKRLACIGKMCTHRCERSCSLNVNGDAVSVRWFKRYLFDLIPLEHHTEILKDTIIVANNKKIAIIGDLLNAISASYYLIKMGYSIDLYVSVFENIYSVFISKYSINIITNKFDFDNLNTYSAIYIANVNYFSMYPFINKNDKNVFVTNLSINASSLDKLIDDGHTGAKNIDALLSMANVKQ